jgi:hypothetical protein
MCGRIIIIIIIRIIIIIIIVKKKRRIAIHRGDVIKIIIRNGAKTIWET